MKKRLLFGALLMGSFLTANAQDDCANAVEIESGDTVTVDGIAGDYEDGCWNTVATAGAWYTFTAPEEGMVTITSNLPQNVAPFSTDTRFSVYTGSCGDLTCYAGNDDVDGAVFLSESSFPVASGEVLYIVWDDYWSDLGFDFEMTFAAESCFAATNFVYTEAPTFTTAGIGWTNSTFGSAPEGYNVEYGPAGFEVGTGTDATVTMTGTGGSAEFEGLTSGTDYEFYIQTNCGDGDLGEWFGPIGFTTAFEAAETPYEYSFETANLNGWTTLNVNAATGSPWTVGADAAASPAQDGDLYMMAGAFGGASDAWLFSRGLDLTAGNTYKVTYYARKWTMAGDGGENNLEVTWGDDTTAAAQENVLATYEDFDEADYEMYENTFTPETSGTYYIGFNYTAPAHTANDHGRIQLDNVSIEDVTGGVNDVLASKFTVYPNPANNVINIANAENILVNGVVITDLNGRTVKNVSYDGVTEAQINVSELAAGMYMMTVSSDKGTMTKKIVKN